MSSTEKTKIAVSGVVKSYGDNHVLTGIDLDIRPGESMVIIGPSACGKTLLLKTMIGLVTPDRGSVVIDGEDIVALSAGRREDAMARAGMQFQQSALFDSLTVWENISFRLTQTRDLTKAEARDIAVEKLGHVGLAPDVADLRPVELSGGMQKRVGLARAIADDPDILFLDEPTAGLDPIMTGIVNQLIVRNAKQLGATTISVTSNMEGARAIADRIAMIYDGRIIWCGPVADIDRSGNEYFDQFIHRRATGPIRMTVGDRA